MKSVSPEPSARDGRWDIAAAVFCFLFGLALIANVHPNGDGLWFWYAHSMLQGQKIYTDLHLNLQPLFVLCTEAFMKLLGTSWIAFKVFPALQLTAYCVGLWLVVRFVPLRNWQRGLLLLAVFGMNLTLSSYRFDDYHITIRCLQLYTVYVFLRLLKGVRPASETWLVAAMGLLCGLATADRLNDGAGLFAACFLALPLLLSRRRLLGEVVLCVSTGVGLLGTVLLTGDSLAAWRLESITRASKIKGGTGPILFSPLTMPYRLLKTLLHPQGAAVVVGVLLLWVLLWRYPAALERGRRLRTSADALLIAVFAAVSAYAAWEGATGLVNEKLGQAGGFLLVLVGLWAHWKLLQWLRGNRTEAWHRSLVLVLVPFWSLMGGTLTSGKFLPAYDADAALLLLIAALAIPSIAAVAWERRSLLVLCMVIVIAFLPEKIERPYLWMHYSDGPLFVGRTVYHHPVWGPMVIETRQLHFIKPMCDLIASTGSGTTLLATPYPYPNYFCDVPPWHGYVQTWYDTSSKETIDGLDAALLKAPPQWILYQRGLDTMGIQEASLDNRRQVPQRAMDREFMDMIEGQRWTVARRVCFEGSDWILMRTTPPDAGEHQGTRSDETDPCKGMPDN